MINKKTRKRAFSSFIFCVLIYFVLIYRLVDIQIIKADEYQTRVENQNTIKYSKNTGRGIIYDRNNIALTDTEKQSVILVSKEELNNNSDILNLIKNTTGLSEVEIFKEFQNQLASAIIELEVDYISEENKTLLEENDIIITEKTFRYASNSLLAHTIGHLKKSDNTGEMGIEKNMESILASSNEEYISVFKAGDSGNKEGLKFLKGATVDVDKNEDSRHIKLTIDYEIQSMVEKIADEEENPTAIIISDIDSGEILSISSRPNFDQNNIEKYFEEDCDDDGVFINRVTKATYAPASIFKLVVLYSALENKVVDENYTYNCVGQVILNEKGETLKCNKLDGHGIQTLQETLSNSCNTAFYDIAQRLGQDKILDSAKTLHLDETVDIGIEETNLNLPESIPLNLLAIGQGSISLTPIQINQMTQIIANNGTYKPLYLYDSIINNNLEKVETFKTTKEEEIISPYRITMVKEMMKNVSKEGTAKDLSDLEGGCGVKTGTAQVTIDSVEATNGLITGYYPEENPKYAITVLVEATVNDGIANNKSAVPIFKEICKGLNKINKKS